MAQFALRSAESKFDWSMGSEKTWGVTRCQDLEQGNVVALSHFHRNHRPCFNGCPDQARVQRRDRAMVLSSFITRNFRVDPELFAETCKNGNLKGQGDVTCGSRTTGTGLRLFYADEKNGQVHFHLNTPVMPLSLQARRRRSRRGLSSRSITASATWKAPIRIALK